MPASEFDLIAAIAERLPPGGEGVRVGSGDDAAVVEPRGASAVSVDAIVDGIHFTLDGFPPEAVGRKALAAGLSDLAAMGALAGEAYVVVGAPLDSPDELLLGVADGLAQVAGREGISVAGGDLVGSPVLIVSVTSIGYEPEGGRLVTRSGAKPGDVVAVTGELGGAAAAVELISNEPGSGDEPTEEVREALLARQLDPHPRLAEGRALAAAGAGAMIDVSDGLGADAAHLAVASSCRVEIELDRVPIAEGVSSVAGGDDAALEMAASGGEDYELLACISADGLAAANDSLAGQGTGLTEIGYVTDGAGVELRLPGGQTLEPSGFDQRRGSRSGSG